MRSGERRKYQFTSIRMPWVNWQLVAMLGGSHNVEYIGEIKVGFYTLTEQVQRQGDHIDIAGALTVAKQGSFNAIGTCH